MLRLWAEIDGAFARYPEDEEVLIFGKALGEGVIDLGPGERGA